MGFHRPGNQLPTAWFDALARLPEPMQPRPHPGTREPIGPDDLAARDDVDHSRLVDA